MSISPLTSDRVIAPIEDDLSFLASLQSELNISRLEIYLKKTEDFVDDDTLEVISDSVHVDQTWVYLDQSKAFLEKDSIEQLPSSSVPAKNRYFLIAVDTKKNQYFIFLPLDNMGAEESKFCLAHATFIIEHQRKMMAMVDAVQKKTFLFCLFGIIGAVLCLLPRSLYTKAYVLAVAGTNFFTLASTLSNLWQAKYLQQHLDANAIEFCGRMLKKEKAIDAIKALKEKELITSDSYNHYFDLLEKIKA